MNPDKEILPTDTTIKSGHGVVGGKAASQPADPDSLYPNGVDPSVSDDLHNARGKWSPYSEKQRMAAAVLIKRYQNEDGLSLQEATKKAFHEVGEPELINEVVKPQSNVSKH